MRCSQDEVNWTACGSVFAQIPGMGAARRCRARVTSGRRTFPTSAGLYHVYYAGSTAGSQQSVIGLATNTTLDPSDPSYKWVDAGEVLESAPGDNFNAIDPNIPIDAAGSFWITYGSYWSGIQQIRVDPRTGCYWRTLQRRFSLATRPGVPNDPIEGASIVHHGDLLLSLRLRRLLL